MQGALGVLVNFTKTNNGVSSAVASAFVATGDYARKDIRGGQLADIAYLLDRGVKVALIFGDRDYKCNCKRYLLYVARPNPTFTLNSYLHGLVANRSL